MKKSLVVLMIAIVTIVVSFGFIKINTTPPTAPVQDTTSEVENLVTTSAPQPEWQVLYQSLDLKKLGLSEETFKYAVTGFQKMHLRKPIIAIADFSQSSRNKRLYVIDLAEKKLIMHTHVAHGRNSGEEYAKRFSNENSSYQSSLGFYRTLGTYQGKHGLSLKLEGVEKGYNDRALERAIVMHGADYVSEDFIRRTGRLGRSLGCPAISMADHKQLIGLLNGGAGLFLYYPDSKYLHTSGLLAGIDIKNDIKEQPAQMVAVRASQP